MDTDHARARVRRRRGTVVPALLAAATVAVVAGLTPPAGGVSGGGRSSTHTNSLPPVSTTTTSGTTGNGQTFGNLVIQDQAGTSNTWSKYVEFQGHTAGVPYAGYRTYVLPATIPASGITSIQVKANYQGPATSTQTWTWKLYNWATATWVTIGDNGGAPDWGSWKVLTFTATGVLSNYVQAGTGNIRVQLVSNNAADDTDIDWENVVVTWNGSLPAAVACTGGPCYAPPTGTTWQWQLTGTVDQTAGASLFDVDMFDTSATVVSQLHAAGKKAYCYIDAGSWENWRPDAPSFPSYVLGKVYAGYPDEKWLDVRRLDVVGPLMQARLDLCRSKGFDGAQFDNVDGWQASTGLNLTRDDDLMFSIWLANEAHRRGLGAAFENALENASTVLPYTDWGISEDCYRFAGDCQKGAAYPAAGKLFGDAEYSASISQFCPVVTPLGIMGMKKNPNLGAYRVPCP